MYSREYCSNGDRKVSVNGTQTICPQIPREIASALAICSPLNSLSTCSDRKKKRKLEFIHCPRAAIARRKESSNSTPLETDVPIYGQSQYAKNCCQVIPRDKVGRVQLVSASRVITVVTICGNGDSHTGLYFPLTQQLSVQPLEHFFRPAVVPWLTVPFTAAAGFFATALALPLTVFVVAVATAASVPLDLCWLARPFSTFPSFHLGSRTLHLS